MNHQFHKIAGQYFNYGYLNRTDKILSLIDNGIPFRKNSRYIANLWSNAYKIKSNGEKELSVKIPEYTGTNITVNAISSFLTENLKDYLKGAIIHGSLATNESINYSDFDGLIILKDTVFKDPSTVKEAGVLLNRAYALMLDFDPIQHHGWFITTESDFTNWPNSYFPPIIFNYSKSLLKNDLNIHLKYTENTHASSLALKSNVTKLIQNLTNNNLPKNAFSLKSVLSEFMLLPTLYVSAKTGKSVYKKISFDLAKVDFSTEEWKIMDEVSAIRASWPVISSKPCVHRSGKVNIYTRRCQKQILIDSNIVTANLTHEFKLKMIQFAELIQSKLL